MLTKADIRKIWELQQETVRKTDPGVPRDLLQDFSIPDRFAVIVTGIRRCGKSTLLNQLQTGKHKDSFYLNFDDNRLYGFDANDFFRLDEVIAESGLRMLFFDELQEITGWERYIRQKLDENYNVVLTGSNATLMSRETGTKLTGRHLDRELFPFSYTEYLEATRKKDDESSFADYMKSGGFPAFIRTGDEQILSDLFEDILIRDIVIRYGVRDVKSLQRLALWLISNTGNLITGSGLRQAAGIQATSTVMEYFSHLESGYLFHFVPRFSYSARSRMINPRKVYSADNGLVTANSASFSDDTGRKLENTVYSHLRRKHKSIFYFSEKRECDFIVPRKGKEPLVIQVCSDLGRDNLERELDGLYEALLFFKIKKGIIVTLNQSDSFIREGMNAAVMPAGEFLRL